MLDSCKYYENYRKKLLTDLLMVGNGLFKFCEFLSNPNDPTFGKVVNFKDIVIINEKHLVSLAICFMR